MGYRRQREDDRSRIDAIRRVLWAILLLNTVVAGAKLAIGMLSGSVAMQADGFHSLFDGMSNVVGLVGMRLAGRPADRDHPYGHGKYESYASAAIGGMLALAAWRVGSAAWAHLSGDVSPPRADTLAFAVMIGTLAVNVAITVWERRVGRRLGSAILVADASHTGSDVFVSLGVIAGLIAVRAGAPWADPVIALGVAAMIAWTGLRVLRQAGDTLSDRARMPIGDVRRAAMEVPGVLGCHSVRTRGSEAEVYADLHVQVAPHLTVEEGHCIAEAVERGLCEAFPQVADAIVHLEPMDDYQRDKTAGEGDGRTG